MNPQLFLQLQGLNQAYLSGIISKGMCDGLSTELINMWVVK